MEKQFVMTFNEAWPQSPKYTWMFSVKGDIFLRQDGDEIVLQFVWMAKCRTLCQMFHNPTESSAIWKIASFTFPQSSKLCWLPFTVLCYEVMVAENAPTWLAFSTIKTCSSSWKISVVTQHLRQGCTSQGKTRTSRTKIQTSEINPILQAEKQKTHISNNNNKKNLLHKIIFTFKGVVFKMFW